MAVRDGMYAVGPHRVRGGRIPATAATVRWEGHPHTEHGAGTWTQGSTKKPHPQQPSVRELAAGLEEDPAAGRPSRAHTIFFYTEQDPYVQPSVWSSACSGATGQRTGGERPPTHHAHNPPPPPQRRGKCTVSYFLHIVCFPSPFFRILHCPAEIEPPLRFFTTPTTQGSQGMTEGNARHAAADNTGVRTRLCTIRQRYATQCQWRNHRRRPNPPLRM